MGGVISCTSIVAAQVDVFPQASVAVHVRVVELVAPQPGVTTSANVTTGAASHISVTIGATNTGAPGHSTGVT